MRLWFTSKGDKRAGFDRAEVASGPCLTMLRFGPTVQTEEAVVTARATWMTCGVGAALLALASSGQAKTQTETWDLVEATISAPDAAPAATDFTVDVEGTLIGGLPADIHAYALWEQAAWSYDANHRAVVSAGTLLDESAFGFGPTYNSAYTLARPAGDHRFTFIFGYRSGSHDWHDVAVEVTVFVAGDCLVQELSPVTLLKGVEDGPGATFEWQPDARASEYHLNTVLDKTHLTALEPLSPHRRPRGNGDTQCRTTATTCTDDDALSGPALLFYQVLSACADTETAEGPVD